MSRWWGCSPGRRSKSLSETGKKWRATTPSIHLGVPDSFSVIPGNGGIWQQLGWNTVCVTSTPTAHTFFSCAFCQRPCPSLLSVVLQVTVISSRIDFTHYAWLKRNMKLCALCLAQNHHISSRNVTRHTALEHYTWHVHSFPDTNYLTFLWILFSVSFNPAPIYVNLSVVHWRKSHPSQVLSPTTIISFSPKTSIPVNNRILPNTRIYVSNHYSSSTEHFFDLRF